MTEWFLQESGTILYYKGMKPYRLSCGEYFAAECRAFCNVGRGLSPGGSFFALAATARSAGSGEIFRAAMKKW